MKYFLFAFSLVMTFTPLITDAAPGIYQCQVVSDASIRPDGSLDLVKDSSRVSQTFTVIKKTGEIIGDVMDPMKNPKVLALGSEKNSYKVIWTQKSSSKNGVFVDYLNIDEFVKGVKKPFGFFSGSLLLTGFCE
jgi:hypothetical protein